MIYDDIYDILDIYSVNDIDIYKCNTNTIVYYLLNVFCLLKVMIMCG